MYGALGVSSLVLHVFCLCIHFVAAIYVCCFVRSMGCPYGTHISPVPMRISRYLWRAPQRLRVAYSLLIAGCCCYYILYCFFFFFNFIACTISYALANSAVSLFCHSFLLKLTYLDGITQIFRTNKIEFS